MILYEYPLNERIRSLLRLEDVLERFAFFRDGAGSHHHMYAVAMLFDLLDVSCRSSVRNDLLAILDEQRRALTEFRNSPNVSAEALERTLTDIDKAHKKLTAMTGKIGQQMRDNEWLMSIRSRIMIAGGAADYDMPSFWAWQNLPVEKRMRNLDEWLSEFSPIQRAVTLVLRLLRESGQAQQLDAPDGSCQHSLNGQPYQMAQIRVDDTLGAVPDISANKYLLWIRFSSFDVRTRPTPVERPVTFELTLCNL